MTPTSGHEKARSGVIRSPGQARRSPPPTLSPRPDAHNRKRSSRVGAEWWDSSIFVMAAVVLAGGIGIEAAALEALVEFEMGRGAPAHPGASISSPSMEPATPPTTTLPPRPTGRPEKHPSKLSIGLGALIALAVAAGLLAWVLIDRSDDDQAAATTPTTAAAAPALGSAPAETLSKPAFQTVAALRAAAAINPNPIYWAGARAGMRLEFSQTSGGTIYVRYLLVGTAAGTLEPHLTVATYPRPERLRRGPGQLRRTREANRSRSRTAALPSTTPRRRRTCTSGSRARPTRSRSSRPRMAWPCASSRTRRSSPSRSANALGAHWPWTSRRVRDKDDLRPPFTTGATCREWVEYEPTLARKSLQKDGFPPP